MKLFEGNYTKDCEHISAFEGILEREKSSLIFWIG